MFSAAPLEQEECREDSVRFSLSYSLFACCLAPHIGFISMYISFLQTISFLNFLPVSCEKFSSPLPPAGN